MQSRNPDALLCEKTKLFIYLMVIIFRRIMSSLALSKLRKRTPLDKIEKSKKKVDRFDGLSEEEVQKYTLPDYLEKNLDIVVVGINPSLMAAHRGRYYAGPGNHFYKLLYESGLTPQHISFDEDYKLPQYGIGLTNIVTRATKSSADLKKTEIKEGAKIVEEKLKYYKPKIAIFNGKCIYEVYANKNSKSSFNFGLQPERIGDSAVWVVPSSSARCANFPRMIDKLHFYLALRRYLQFLKGEIKEVDPREFLFEGKCKQHIPSTSKMWRRKNVSAFMHGGRVANKDTIYLDTSDENIAIVCSTEFVVKRLNQENPDNEKVCSLEENLNLSQINNEILNENVQDKLQENIELKSSLSDQNNKTKFTESANVKIKNKCYRKQRKIKRLPSTNIQVQKTTKTDYSLDFVKLIKKRLLEKTDDVEDAKNEN